MSIRVLLSVVLATALVAAAAPAVDSARTARADDTANVAVDEVADAIAALQRSDPAPTPDLAARRVIRVRLPDRPASTDSVLVVGSIDGDRGSQSSDQADARADTRADGPRSDVLVARVAGRQRVRRVHVDLRVRRIGTESVGGVATVAADDEGLRIADDTWLVLVYVERDGRPTIIVREFIPRDAANASHAV